MSIVMRLSTASNLTRRLAIALLLLATAVAAYAAVELSVADPQLASWWPAAGLASMAAMLARGRERWAVIVLVIVATGTGNIFAGRDALFALLLGAGNSVEVAIIAALLAPGGTPVRLSTLRQMSRFIMVALGAAVASGLALAVVAAVFVSRPLIEGFAQLSVSHASATLVILPVVLVPIMRGKGQGQRTGEIVIQSFVLLAAVIFFFWPGGLWPVSFAPFVAFWWSAFRFPLVVGASQVLVTILLVVVLTTLGGGPVSTIDADGHETVVLVQVGLLVFAITALLVSSARADWHAVVNRLRAQEELLREGIVAADVGIIIAERTETGLEIVARNERALRVVGEQGPPFGVEAIDRVVEEASSEHVVFERDGRIFDASIAERRSPDGPVLVTIVITDTTERDVRERFALESAEQLRQLNAQKDDFISSVSHELRTPVTSILGFSEQLGSVALPPEAAEAGEIIARNARRLADVIDDVLELSRLSAVGGVHSPSEPIDLVLLVTECARDVEGLTIDRRVTVQVVAPDGVVMVKSRARELMRVCTNLLTNAVKFSHDDGTVAIEVCRDGDGAVVRVVDHGIGIPLEYRDMIWERFARVPLDSHRAVPGTGLGLPIVKALIEQRLGGTVTLTDTSGGGTTAELRLPREAPGVSLAPMSV